MSGSRKGRARSVFVDVLVVGLVASICLAVGASGHNWQNHYNKFWSDPANLSIDWRFRADFPTGNWRERVKDGASNWNVQGQSLQFVKATTDAPINNPSCGTYYQDNVVYKENRGPGLVGVVEPCYYVTPPWYYSFRLIFNDYYTFYKETGTPPPGQHDAWAVAAHEFGHGTGWGPDAMHFSGPTLCPAPPANRHTMCATIPNGDKSMRHLDVHDADTFNGLY